MTQAVEDGYRTAQPLLADATGPNMRRLAADHRRLLGNGQVFTPLLDDIGGGPCTD